MALTDQNGVSYTRDKIIAHQGRVANTLGLLLHYTRSSILKGYNARSLIVHGVYLNDDNIENWITSNKRVRIKDVQSIFRHFDFSYKGRHTVDPVFDFELHFVHGAVLPSDGDLSNKLTVWCKMEGQQVLCVEDVIEGMRKFDFSLDGDWKGENTFKLNCSWFFSSADEFAKYMLMSRRC